MGSSRREQLTVSAEGGVSPTGADNPKVRRARSHDPLRLWVREFLAEVASPEVASGTRVRPISAVASAVAAGSAELGCPIAPDVDNEICDELSKLVNDYPVPPGGWASPWLPGLIHELAVSGANRKARGAWYTPRTLVVGLVGFVYRVADVPDFVVDPTCGGGAFLLAALDHMVAEGVDPQVALGMVAGTDIDQDAVTVSRWALQLWAGSQGIEPATVAVDVTTADALAIDAPARWPSRRLVVGNPPFASPLKTGAFPSSAAEYRLNHCDDLGQYADMAALHLHRCVTQASAGSVVALVMPQSVVSSRDVAEFRARLLSTTSTIGMWAAREAVFEAGVRTCTPVIVLGGAQAKTVHLASGPTVESVGSTSSGRWSSYAARCLGSPKLPTSLWRPVSTLADLCQATAGFRDEYYGLVAACRERGDADPPNRLVTVGCVDPLTTTWGRRPIRFGGQQWQAPVIDTEKLDDKVGRWWQRQARPKLVVATQSKILEPVVDLDGGLVPSTPLLAVHADSDDLPWIAAVLLAPPVVACAWERWFGSALAVDALKLAARQVAELPLPFDRDIWRQAAELIALHVEADGLLPPDRAQPLAVQIATLMNKAYGADEAVLNWWLDRAGHNRSAGSERDR